MPDLTDIDEYIESFPPHARAALSAVRDAIRRAAPGTDETISYGIPTFTLDGRYVVYFAGWTHHVSLYPIPHADDGLRRDLAPYVSGKGTLRFPLGEPLPIDLIGRVAVALLAERRSRDR